MAKHNMLLSLRHVFKLDPDRSITEEQVSKLAQSGTDGIIVGGTLGVTYEGTEQLLREIRKNGVYPIIQEISNIEAIVPGFDFYFIPLVLNAQHPNWILHIHQQALKKYGELINWDQVIVEGYIVLNEESSVARLTESKTDIDLDDILAYSRMGEKMLQLPIIYIEYSGQYGNPEVVEEVRNIVEHARVVYGGGIRTVEHASQMLQYADTIVIGNLIYENFDLAIETVNSKMRENIEQ